VWFATTGPITTNTGPPARTGSWKLWLGGNARTSTEYEQLAVAIPSTGGPRHRGVGRGRPHRDDGHVEVADLVVLALLVVAGAGAALVWRRVVRRRVEREPDTLLLDDEEHRELAAALAAVAAEHSGPLQQLLAVQLDRLHRRRVPIRVIRATDDPPVVRLCFADGTVIRARPTRPGDWALSLIHI